MIIFARLLSTAMATTYTFLTHNDFFNNYLIINPDFSRYQDFFHLGAVTPNTTQTNTAKIYISIAADRDDGYHIYFEHLKTVLTENYPNVDLATDRIKGGHKKVREESLELGLKFILE